MPQRVVTALSPSHPTQDLGWGKDTKASIVDLVTKEKSTATGAFQATVASHGVVHVVLTQN